jgi:enoyl-CoA hydratase
MDEVIAYEKRGRVAILTLDRPEARNAINGAVAQRMEALIDAYETDDEVWVAILTGAGGTFCAGADLKEIAAGRANELSTRRGGFAGMVSRERNKPLIAAVAGHAVAGGTEIALACDMIVCADDAVFGLPEVKRSLIAATGGLFRLPRFVGMAAAMEIILTGDPFTAQRAYELGMVNAVVPADEVAAHAWALAERVAANAPLAVAASRRVAAQAFGADDTFLFAESMREFGAIARTEDFAEGPRAFIEKRAPDWKGR